MWNYISDRLEKNFRRTVFAAPGTGAGRRRAVIVPQAEASVAASRSKRGAEHENRTDSFASLSPTLLARKGGARPAMRPQHGGLSGMDATKSSASDETMALDDLGWNDMGDEGGTSSAPRASDLTPEPANEPPPRREAEARRSRRRGSRS